MNPKTQYLLASIVESSQDSIVSIDLDRIITSWNQAAEELYGYPAKEAIGRPLHMVMLPEDIQDLIEKVNYIKHEITVPVYETIRVHKNGRQADLEIFLSPVRDEGGQVVGVSTIARDISIRKMQEKQKDEFIDIASHELKTPVTCIKAWAELLFERLESSTDQVNATMVKQLVGQLNKLTGLIGVLLDTTKLAAGEIRLTPEPMDVNEMIEEQIAMLAPISRNHHLIFLPGAIQSVVADRKQIGRVTTNIISNSMKYSPDGGDIIISTSETEDSIKVCVQDFGVGIPVAMKDKIFDRYFRVENPATQTASGIGLGLYITKGIIEQHKGAIHVESEEGKGSTFCFTLLY